MSNDCIDTLQLQRCTLMTRCVLQDVNGIHFISIVASLLHQKPTLLQEYMAGVERGRPKTMDLSPVRACNYSFECRLLQLASIIPRPRIPNKENVQLILGGLCKLPSRTFRVCLGCVYIGGNKYCRWQKTL